MGEEMGTHLQQALQNLCEKTKWKYAIFWKLKWQPHMMLTWENAYYDCRGSFYPSKEVAANMHSSMAHQIFNKDQVDSLQIALAKISSLVHSVGEGIVGQVAFTGKHQWILADELESKSWSSYECSDHLESQFSAGVKTVAVVAVMPIGVVQLGSLYSIGEDLKLISHIKDSFCLHNSSTQVHPSLILLNSKKTLNTPEMIVKNQDLDVFSDCSNVFSSIIPRERTNLRSYSWPSFRSCNISSQSALIFPYVCQQKPLFISGDHANPALGVARDHINLRSKAGNICSEFQKQVQLKQLSSEDFVEEAKPSELPPGTSSSCCASLPVDLCGPGCVTGAQDLPVKSGQAASLLHEECELHQLSQMQIRPDMERYFHCQNMPTWNTTLKNQINFSDGAELQEALRPAFKEKQDCHIWEDCVTSTSEALSHVTDGTSNGLFMPENGSENLLEAVVASALVNCGSITGGGSTCESRSVSTTEHVVQSSDELFGLRSASDFAPGSSSFCSGLSEQQSDQTKSNRKKTKAGETCRPRPRDRQLIQDRIKELRQIVPNGSKCSIDALLERTVKHMLFLQSVTKHAEKLKRYVESKLFDKSNRVLGSCNYEHGASWIVEVGEQSKACPIKIENMDMNGQMLIEMLCEECNLFLEIAEAIRSLGLTILRGVIETHDEKTWACFVVEGKGKSPVQRMDIMWSLVRFFQPQTKP